MVSQKRALVRKNVSKVAKKNTRSYRRGRKSILRKRKNRNVSVKNRRRLKTKKNRRARKIRSKRFRKMMGGMDGSDNIKLQDAGQAHLYTSCLDMVYKYIALQNILLPNYIGSNHIIPYKIYRPASRDIKYLDLVEIIRTSKSKKGFGGGTNEKIEFQAIPYFEYKPSSIYTSLENKSITEKKDGSVTNLGAILNFTKLKNILPGFNNDNINLNPVLTETENDLQDELKPFPTKYDEEEESHNFKEKKEITTRKIPDATTNQYIFDNGDTNLDNSANSEKSKDFKRDNSLTLEFLKYLRRIFNANELGNHITIQKNNAIPTDTIYYYILDEQYKEYGRIYYLLPDRPTHVKHKQIIMPNPNTFNLADIVTSEDIKIMSGKNMKEKTIKLNISDTTFNLYERLDKSSTPFDFLGYVYFLSIETDANKIKALAQILLKIYSEENDTITQHFIKYIKEHPTLTENEKITQFNNLSSGRKDNLTVFLKAEETEIKLKAQQEEAVSLNVIELDRTSFDRQTLVIKSTETSNKEVLNYKDLENITNLIDSKHLTNINNTDLTVPDYFVEKLNSIKKESGTIIYNSQLNDTQYNQSFTGILHTSADTVVLEKNLTISLFIRKKKKAQTPLNPINDPIYCSTIRPSLNDGLVDYKDFHTYKTKFVPNATDPVHANLITKQNFTVLFKKVGGQSKNLTFFSSYLNGNCSYEGVPYFKRFIYLDKNHENQNQIFNTVQVNSSHQEFDTKLENTSKPFFEMLKCYKHLNFGEIQFKIQHIYTSHVFPAEYEHGENTAYLSEKISDKYFSTHIIDNELAASAEDADAAASAEDADAAASKSADATASADLNKDVYFEHTTTKNEFNYTKTIAGDTLSEFKHFSIVSAANPIEFKELKPILESESNLKLMFELNINSKLNMFSELDIVITFIPNIKYIMAKVVNNKCILFKIYYNDIRIKINSGENESRIETIKDLDYLETTLNTMTLPVGLGLTELTLVEYENKKLVHYNRDKDSLIIGNTFKITLNKEITKFEIYKEDETITTYNTINTVLPRVTKIEEQQPKPNHNPFSPNKRETDNYYINAFDTYFVIGDPRKSNYADLNIVNYNFKYVGDDITKESLIDFEVRLLNRIKSPYEEKKLKYNSYEFLYGFNCNDYKLILNFSKIKVNKLLETLDLYDNNPISFDFLEKIEILINEFSGKPKRDQMSLYNQRINDLHTNFNIRKKKEISFSLFTANMKPQINMNQLMDNLIIQKFREIGEDNFHPTKDTLEYYLDTKPDVPLKTQKSYPGGTSTPTISIRTADLDIRGKKQITLKAKYKYGLETKSYLFVDSKFENNKAILSNNTKTKQAEFEYLNYLTPTYLRNG